MAAIAAVVGCTGLVGSHILEETLASSRFSRVLTFSRRQPISSTPESAAKLQAVIDGDSAKWTESIRATAPPAQVFFSALGTTRGAAGSLQGQYKVDHDLNVELAKAAAESGTRVYTLISSAGSDSKSISGYWKLKGQIEESVGALGFEHVVLLRPGFLMGQREKMGIAESGMKYLAGAAGKLSNGLLDFWAQDAKVVARAAVHATLICLQGNREKGVWIVDQKEVVRLGRTEWPPKV